MSGSTTVQGSGPASAGAEALEASIKELRAAGRWEDAVPLCRDLVELRRRDPQASWQRVDADWALRTVRAAARLSETERAELAWADRMEPEVQAAYSEGRFARGLELVEQQLEIRKLLTMRHPEVIATMVNRAAFLQAQGALPAAETDLRRALVLMPDLLGAEHPGLYEAKSNLASVLRGLGAYFEAERVCVEALAGWRRIHGGDHPLVAVALNNLSVIRQDGGNYIGAEAPCREALAIWRRVLGERHPQVAASLGNLAMLFQRKGDHERAQAFYRDALAVMIECRGPEHPDVAVSLSNLAVVLRESPAGREEAERLFRQSLSMMRKLLGNEHPLVATCLNNLAVLLLDLKQPAEAAALQEQSLDLWRKNMGEEHPDTARAERNLASMLRARGELCRAELLCREAIEKQERLLGPRHPELARSYGELAKILWIKGHLKEAPSALMDHALAFEDARLRAVSATEWATFQRSPYNALALVLLALCKKREAWEAAERGLARCQRLITETGTAEQTIPLERVQQGIAPGAAIIGWISADPELLGTADWGYVIRRHGPVAWAKLRANAAPAAEEFRQRTIAHPPIPALGGESARAVAANCLDPLLPLLEQPEARRTEGRGTVESQEVVRELIVIPSGPMVGVPVEPLLLDGGKAGQVPLIERFRVTYAPSATIYTWLSELRGGEG